jgi:hypothetical protein
MKNGITLLIQAVLLIAVLAFLIDGLIRVPDIETIHIIIRAVCVGIVAGNFSLALHSYMKGD